MHNLAVTVLAGVFLAATAIGCGSKPTAEIVTQHEVPSTSQKGKAKTLEPDAITHPPPP